MSRNASVETANQPAFFWNDCMKMIRRWYRWFLARFRLNLRVVCEESAGLGPHDDFHDAPDAGEDFYYDFVLLKCKRCDKDFYI